MQVDEHIVTALPVLLGVVAALQSQVAPVVDLEVLPDDFVALYDDAGRAKVAELIEVPGGANEDISNFLHIGREQIHPS